MQEQVTRFRRLARVVRRLRRLSRKRLLILIEALVCVTGAKLLIHSIPFRFAAQTMGQGSVESPRLVGDGCSAVMADIGWALTAIGRRVSALRQCLPQAMAGYWMARRRKIPSTIYFGTRWEAGSISAHAWLRAGDGLVVGGESRDGHQVIAVFGDA